MTALEYSGVVGAGRGFTTVRTPDGRELTISGTRSTRNNNPGNIEYGPFARSQGAIGSDGRFAVFPSRQAGYKAMEGLVFGGKYSNLSLKQAIERYAPPFENNSLAYARAVANRVGVSLATKMRDIPGNLRGAVTQAMANVEGMGRATVKDPQGNVVGRIDPSRSPLPETPPLPPQRFQAIASRPVTPDAQAIRTAATLGALPVGGSTRLPAQTFAAPAGKVERSPLAAIAQAINPVSSAQAAPRPNNPTLTPGAMGQGTMSLPSFASARMMAPPNVPTQRLGAPATPPSLSPKQVAAYREYANTRAYAPIDPVPARMPSPPTDGFLTSALPIGPAQTLQPQPAQPTFVPTPVQNPVQTPPVPQPPVQTLPKPTQQRIDEAFAQAAPPPTPRFTAADVYAGRAQTGQATGGNTVSRDPFGNIGVTNQYGVTTMTGPDGRQMASSGPFGGGGIAGPMGPRPPSSQADLPSVPQAPSRMGNMVRGGVGTVVGGGLGGLLAGPIGAALGAVVARDLALGKNPIDRLGIGTFDREVMTPFGPQKMTFANAKSGGAFPDAPRGASGALGGKDSNRSERSMRDISPAATRDIKSGKSGLY